VRACVGPIPHPKSPTNYPNRFIKFQKNKFWNRNRPRGLILERR
jgi:hypothetical protein